MSSNHTLKHKTCNLAVTETCNSNIADFIHNIDGYDSVKKSRINKNGAALFVNENIQFSIRKDISTDSLFIEIIKNFLNLNKKKSDNS